MIKNLQLESGAKIQITRDADADLHCATRDVELMGTQEQISRAEQRINEVIAEVSKRASYFAVNIFFLKFSKQTKLYWLSRQMQQALPHLE